MVSQVLQCPQLIISDDNYVADSIQLLSKLRGDWKPEDVVFKVFTEGITNKLFRVSNKNDAALNDAIVIRLYGKKTELIIDRDAEKKNMQLLHAFECGSPLLASFGNGIAYGFVKGECLNETSVRDPHIGSLIAKEMVKMHRIDPTKFGPELMLDTAPFIFKRAHHYLELSPDSFQDPAKNEKLKTKIPNKEVLREELKELEEKLSVLDSPVVFSHNDLLLKNIVYNRESDSVTFIDFEYGAFNFEAHDIGNHFCEWAGMDTVDYSLYPDKPTQEAWLRHYLEHKRKAEGKNPAEISDRDVEILYVQANKFSLLANFFWGIWALIQSKFSDIDFDYLDYSKVRLDEYFAKKEKFLSLKMP